MRHKGHSIALMVIGLLLAACSQTNSLEPFNILEEGEPVPIAFAQGFSLGARVSEGLDTLSTTLDTYTMLAHDLKGYPFLHLTIIAPRVIGNDIYAFAKSLSGQEWAGHGNDSPWSVTITGATDVRDVFVTTNVGLDLLRAMVRTIDAMGGPGTPQELVAVELDYFVLKDTQGRLWEIGATTPLSSSARQNLIDTYNTMYQANNTPEVRDAARAQANSTASLASLTGADGSRWT